MSLSVDLITHADTLSQDDLKLWNQLATNPLQRWEWLGSWWFAYQREYQFSVLSVRRDGQPIAFAPWCIEKRLSTGRTIQFLGSGKACTDHLSLLVRPEDTNLVCESIANWLVHAGSKANKELPRTHLWDSIELIGVDATDAPINCLTESLQNARLDVRRSEGTGCYVIDLPSEWDDYVKMRSKSGRREIRQSLKNVDSGKITVQIVKNEQELAGLWDLFVALHQRRRHASGTTGCFDHPPFGLFLRKAAGELLKAGLLQLVVAKADGVPVATQFAIVDEDTWYFYQSGMEPDAAELRPGLSVFCHAIRETIQIGRKRFDMMRGDEPYKPRWRAELQPAQEIRVCSPRFAAQLRNQVYSAGLAFKNLVKSGIGIGQPQ